MLSPTVVIHIKDLLTGPLESIIAFIDKCAIMNLYQEFDYFMELYHKSKLADSINGTITCEHNLNLDSPNLNDLPYSSLSPMYLAVKSNSLDMVRSLFKNGALADITPLEEEPDGGPFVSLGSTAIDLEHYEIGHFFLSNRPTPSPDLDITAEVIILSEPQYLFQEKLLVDAFNQCPKLLDLVLTNKDVRKNICIGKINPYILKLLFDIGAMPDFPTKVRNHFRNKEVGKFHYFIQNWFKRSQADMSMIEFLLDQFKATGDIEKQADLLYTKANERGHFTTCVVFVKKLNYPIQPLPETTMYHLAKLIYPNETIDGIFDIFFKDPVNTELITHIINGISNTGRPVPLSPLLLAIKHGRAYLAKRLVEHGAQPFHPDFCLFEYSLESTLLSLFTSPYLGHDANHASLSNDAMKYLQPHSSPHIVTQTWQVIEQFPQLVNALSVNIDDSITLFTASILTISTSRRHKELSPRQHDIDSLYFNSYAFVKNGASPVIRYNYRNSEKGKLPQRHPSITLNHSSTYHGFTPITISAFGGPCMKSKDSFYDRNDDDTLHSAVLHGICDALVDILLENNSIYKNNTATTTPTDTIKIDQDDDLAAVVDQWEWMKTDVIDFKRKPLPLLKKPRTATTIRKKTKTARPLPQRSR